MARGASYVSQSGELGVNWGEESKLGARGVSWEQPLPHTGGEEPNT